MTEIYLITGALGAGKTTFLINLLKKYENKKIAVLINEIGAIGIDGTIVERDGIEKLELSNGSIFCSCLKDKFIDGLVELIQMKPDIIFIESSGIADPSNMNSVLEVLKIRVESKYRYKGVICLIDAVYFLKQVQMLVNIERQVAQGDILIINKTDLLSDKEEIGKIEEKLRQIKEQSTILKTEYGNIDINDLKSFELTSKNEADTINKPDNKPFIVSIKFEIETTLNHVKKFFESIKRDCQRIKGFVKISEGIYKIDSVYDNLDIIRIEEKEEYVNKMVLISNKGSHLISRVIEETKDIKCEFKLG